MTTVVVGTSALGTGHALTSVTAHTGVATSGDLGTQECYPLNGMTSAPLCYPVLIVKSL
jgi:hypothetical protein